MGLLAKDYERPAQTFSVTRCVRNLRRLERARQALQEHEHAATRASFQREIDDRTELAELWRKRVPAALESQKSALAEAVEGSAEHKRAARAVAVLEAEAP